MTGNAKEFFAVRLPPEHLAVLKAEADARGVRVAVLAREAVAEWIARHVDHQCPGCGASNPATSIRCGCGVPLTPAAIRADAEEVARTGRAFGDAVAKIEAYLAEAAAARCESEEILSRVRAIEERARAKARQVELAGTRPNGDPDLVPTLAQGREPPVRDIVADKIGMSHGTFDKAKIVWRRRRRPGASRKRSCPG
jgi:hypothetical protein